ncbi:phospholipase A-2-activating protein [Daktulosphaira vitifoliae]|uniref:phospholipase A-2-activating protein n=1 Tax=Daktulosphaira vitifoliae TaxID=58002 RepID=UPI0021A9BB51|nr:phospholipase A-2-activating protein [Daktulosphaira vitifoliae]
MAYKLSSVVYGHVLDVRGLSSTSNGYIVSVSRDKTAKLWKPNSENAGYTEVQTFSGHTNYVVSVTVLKESSILPSGLIITGGNDKMLCGFLPESSEPIFVETRHKNTVCKINPGVLLNTFISSSWDSTAMLWKVTVDSDQTYQPVLLSIFKGHTAAVWSAIQLSSKYVITCSADKTILIHNIIPGDPQNSSVIIKKLTGHTDCVRDLAALNTESNEFLSCSNDATVIRWNAETGECLEKFYGHPNYIYCLAVFSGIDMASSIVVTGGEDRYLNIWMCTDQQVILQPAQSIWAVTILPNKDIVVGSSDGIIRIFTTDVNRQASSEVLASFQEQVDNINQQAQKEIGGIKVENLPGPEVLYQPGKNDGQIIMINENGKAICYKWLSNECKWDKVGDVLSASDPNKNMHNGKEYDFVWNVDIEDGAPPLKLPYNKDEDPWSVAQSFIHKHDLPQSYLETVANFIISNSKTSAPTLLPANQDYVDPYTGAARYVPTSNPTTSSSNGQDPFTGQSRHVPNTPISYNTFFPQTSYLKFDQANISSIFSKIKEFNLKLDDSNNKLEDHQLESVMKMCNEGSNVDDTSINILIHLLDWPKDILFPILDVTRLAVRNKHVNVTLCANNLIMTKLQPHIYDNKVPTNQMLAFRCLCNLMQHEEGELLVLRNYEELLTVIQSLSQVNLIQKHLQIALATLLLNFSVMIKQSDDDIAIQAVNNAISSVCPKLSEPEAIFRCFVAIGTLVILKNQPDLSEQIKDYIALMASNSEPSKVLSCSKHLMKLIQK